jgi:hypothetical protein
MKLVQRRLQYGELASSFESPQDVAAIQSLINELNSRLGDRAVIIEAKVETKQTSVGPTAVLQLHQLD